MIVIQPSSASNYCFPDGVTIPATTELSDIITAGHVTILFTGSTMPPIAITTDHSVQYCSPK